MKKALAGPAKRTAKKRTAKKPERRAMIAAVRQRIRSAPGRAAKRLKAAPAAVRKAPATFLRLTRRVDRRANRLLLRAWPPLERRWRRVHARTKRWGRWTWRRLRPHVVRLFRLLAWLERHLLRTRDLAVRLAIRASGVLTPERAICATIAAAAVCLAVSQFVDYRAVEIGQPGYAGLATATPPTVGAEAAGEAHAYLLLPIALIAAVLAALVARNGRRRGLGRIVFALGALSLAVVLLVDMPAGLDESAQASSFSGATAVLGDGFYAEIASAAGLMLAGLLLVVAPKTAARYHARPCRTRTNLFARGASALRRRRRRRASSRARATKRALRRRNGEASAPASPR
jgi:hypothetical protein